MPQDSSKLSTTALARKLNIPAQQLFATLKDFDWIRRVDDTWALTSKGEFEGGSFQKSKRYGTYIVWPERLDQHPLLAAIESNLRITAASMCRYYPPLHARQINRALAELGLQTHSILGWELTPMGRTLGGQQAESNNSGAFYVTWPHEIIDNPVVHRELSQQSNQLQGPEPAPDSDTDLFAESGREILPGRGIDGHCLNSPLKTSVCNWLYLAQLAHAVERALPVEELVFADFYLPAGHIYIDCWEADIPAGQLAAKLDKRELYRTLQLRNLEINADDSENLDEVLGRGLLAFGIRC